MASPDAWCLPLASGLAVVGEMPARDGEFSDFCSVPIPLLERRERLLHRLPAKGAALQHARHLTRCPRVVLTVDHHRLGLISKLAPILARAERNVEAASERGRRGDRNEKFGNAQDSTVAHPDLHVGICMQSRRAWDVPQDSGKRPRNGTRESMLTLIR